MVKWNSYGATPSVRPSVTPLSYEGALPVHSKTGFYFFLRIIIFIVQNVRKTTVPLPFISEV